MQETELCERDGWLLRDLVGFGPVAVLGANTDPGLLDMVRGCLGIAGATLTPAQVLTSRAGHTPIIVHDGTNERGLLRALAARFPGRWILSLRHDVVPALLASDGTAPEGRRPGTAYAIVCAPRSGSWLLCNLLEQNGLG